MEKGRDKEKRKKNKTDKMGKRERKCLKDGKMKKK